MLDFPPKNPFYPVFLSIQKTVHQNVTTLLSDVAVAAVCGGSAAAHCVAIAEDGRVFTWGRNENGQLGHGDKDDRAAPTEVKGLPEGVRVVGGSCGELVRRVQGGSSGLG